MSHHDNAVQLANCSILHDERQKNVIQMLDVHCVQKNHPSKFPFVTHNLQTRKYDVSMTSLVTKNI